jgi:quinol monooxygenase YgiN
VAPALLAAAAGGGLSVALLKRWRLQSAKGVDLTPAMSWPSPATAADINPASGPVLVTIVYRIDPKTREAFLEAIEQAGRERYRDGAYRWEVFEDPGDDSRFVETFLSDSWMDHLRQHERVTKADQAQEDAVLRFQIGEGPQITHLVAARSRVRRGRGHEARHVTSGAHGRRSRADAQAPRDIDDPTHPPETDSAGEPPPS